MLSVALRHGFRLPGRVVLAVHPERGLAQLSDLVTEHQAGKSFECLSLSFRGEIRLLVPATEAGRVWRYGVGSAARLDRLDPPTWRQRRDAAESEIQATAAKLVAGMRERQARTAPVIEPTDAYRRFTRLMPFVLTADQAVAVRVDPPRSGRRPSHIAAGLRRCLVRQDGSGAACGRARRLRGVSGDRRGSPLRCFWRGII